MPTIAVTTANICGNPLRPRWAVRKRMRRALMQPGVTFGQEVARSNRWRRGNYSAMWHRVAGALGKTTFGGGHEVPISIPNGWTIDGSEVVLAHTGRAGVSPNRFLTVVRVELDGEPVAFVNCHTVSKPRRGVPAAAWRIQQWDTYLSRLEQVVAQLHSGGYTVVFGGDMNKRDVPRVHPSQLTLIESGLDHLWMVPADGMTLAAVHRHVVGRTAVLMDHPILSATFTISGAHR